PSSPAGTPKVVVTSERVDRFERWMQAVEAHEPGVVDDAVDEVGSWPGTTLRALWVDAKFLAGLLRNLKMARSQITTPQGTVEIVYPDEILQRMRAFACAASGRLQRPDCMLIHASENLDGDLRALAAHAFADRSATGEDNYLLRRAAVLHADIEIIGTAVP